jgi:ATP-dependent RNA helicase DeaD
LSNVKFLVLDEVDRMLDMGFSRDVEKILKLCPVNRQTFLFSATISKDIAHLIKKHTRDPVEVSVKSYVDHSKLKQVYYDVPSNMKFSLLVHLLKKEKADLVMVFSNTRRNADLVAGNLFKLGINAQVIHGGLTQGKRIKVLEDFHGKGVGVLICTDVAARGLDIKGVTHVYNYDIPDVANDYVHRIGRTARAGSEGIAINLISSRDYENFRNVMKNKELNITKEEMPVIERVEMDLAAGKKKDFRDSIGRGRSQPRREGSYSRGPSRNNYKRNDEDESRPRRDFRSGSRERFGRESSRNSSGKKVFNKRREINEQFSDEGREARPERKPFGRTGFKKSFGSRRSFGDDSPRRSSTERPARSFGREKRSYDKDSPRKSFVETKSGGENRARSGRFAGSKTPRREVARSEKRSERTSSGPRTNRDSKYKRTPSRDSRKPIRKKY